MLLFFSLAIIHAINVPLSHLVLSIFREISSSIPTERTFPRLDSFLKVFFDTGSWNQSFSLFYCVCEYKGFNKIGLIVENSALRYQFLIVFFQYYFVRGESHDFIFYIMAFWKLEKWSNFTVYVLLHPICAGEISVVIIINK